MQASLSANSAPPLDIAAMVRPADWLGLPPSLRRRFATGHGPTVYIGRMDFERSVTGAVFAWLARVLGAPLALERGKGEPVTVHVDPLPGGVAWSRQFGAQRLRSVKSAGRGGTVLERTDGGLGMVLDVTVEERALVFTSRSFFLAVGRWRLPIPAMLTPGQCRVEHRAVTEASFRFTLTMVHPVWGTTFRQTGVFADSRDSQDADELLSQMKGRYTSMTM